VRGRCGLAGPGAAAKISGSPCDAIVNCRCRDCRFVSAVLVSSTTSSSQAVALSRTVWRQHKNRGKKWETRSGRTGRQEQEQEPEDKTKPT
jgi:hypothetical protein